MIKWLRLADNVSAGGFVKEPLQFWSLDPTVFGEVEQHVFCIRKRKVSRFSLKYVLTIYNIATKNVLVVK